MNARPKPALSILSEMCKSSLMKTRFVILVDRFGALLVFVVPKSDLLIYLSYSLV